MESAIWQGTPSKTWRQPPASNQLEDGFLLHCSVACPVISNSLRPHGLQHSRPLCPSLSPEVCPSSCPFHPWCHPVSSSSDALFSFCPQSFPASRTFPMSQLFTSGDQNTGVSASASVLSMNIQDWFLLGLTGLISPTPQFQSISSYVLSFLSGSTLADGADGLPA